MRQEHHAGEKVFVDFANGQSIVDRLTGELIPAHLFLAVWGASHYTYAEATLTRALPSWIGAHRRALEYFQCAPRVLVPDNLKGGVNKACRHEPELNPTMPTWRSTMAAPSCRRVFTMPETRPKSRWAC